jgi:hypothetical protein
MSRNKLPIPERGSTNLSGVCPFMLLIFAVG